jgi:shikimate kinase
MNKMKTLQLHKPHMLVVVGLPGAGKSFFATQFSDMFHTPYLDYGHYRYAARDEQTAVELADHALLQLLKTEQTIIVEGIGLTDEDRRELKLLTHKKGYEILYIWVQTDPRVAQQRAVYSKTATMTEQEFAERAQGFETLSVKTDKYVVVSGKHTYATQAKMVLKKLVVGKANKPLGGSSRPTPPRGRLTIG